MYAFNWIGDLGIVLDPLIYAGLRGPWKGGRAYVQHGEDDSELVLCQSCW
jgi:hypothetical protein